MKRKKIEEKKGFRLRYVVLAMALIFVIFALFSHNASDLDVLAGGSDSLIKNPFGRIGAHISRILLYSFGVASFPIVILLAVCIVRTFIPIPTKRVGYVKALLVTICGITLLFAMYPESFVHITNEYGIGHIESASSAVSGGFLAQILVAPEPDIGIIRGLIGNAGTLLCSSVLLVFGLIFIWISDWQSVLKVILKYIKTRQEQKRKEERKNKAKKGDKEDEDENDENEKVEDNKNPEMIAEQIIAKQENDITENEINDNDNDENLEEEELNSQSLASPKISRPNEDEETEKTKRTYSTAQVNLPDYVLPPISLLEKITPSKGENNDTINETTISLQQTLNDFKVPGEVINVITGPRISRYEISLEPGVNVKKVTTIEKNIAMELAAESIRILAPIPGKSAVGVEVPNTKSSIVGFRNLLESSQWRNSRMELPIILGKDVSGKAIILDLVKAPHLLIAGATGSGKSVCMNALIMSLLFKHSPEDLRLIMVDPKVVEMEMYSSLPHLITPVVNESNKVPLALRWGVNEMEKRYKVLAKVKVKNLKGFNERPKSETPEYDNDNNLIPSKMPYVVIIVDELADVMMTDAKSDVEMSIARIAQKGRAAGIHIVIATQRPSTNIITGVIKANLPTRIAFRVGSGIDSRVVLDSVGAEKLLGQGDMLFIPPGGPNAERIQGAWVKDNDIMNIVEFVSDQADQDFDTEVVSEDEDEDADNNNTTNKNEVAKNSAVQGLINKYIEPNDDDLMKQTIEIILTDRKVSTSYIQRRLGIGYNKAAGIIDTLEKRGIVSPPLPGGSKREILITDSIEAN